MIRIWCYHAADQTKGWSSPKKVQEWPGQTDGYFSQCIVVFPQFAPKKKNPPWILAGNPKSDAPATLWWLWCEPSWWVAASGILHIAVAVGLWSPNGAPGVCPPWFSSPSSLDSIAPFWSSHRSTPNFRSREKTSQSDLIPKPNTGKNKPFEHFKPPQRGQYLVEKTV